MVLAEGALKMTQRKKWIAVLLAAVFILSAFSTAFCASAEEQTCTVLVDLYGSGTVTDGTTTASAPASLMLTCTVGRTVTLTATPGANRETAYWVNGETDRILSFANAYSFTAGTDLYLYVSFEEAQDVAAQNGRHQVVYLSEGDNIYYSETISIGSTAYYESNIASIMPYSDGKTWTGWDKTPEEVAADTGRVFVRPTYDNTASYTVTTVIDGVATKSQGTYGGNFNASAPATLHGEPFSYWVVPKDDDNPNSQTVIASYNAFYQFIVVMPITLEAVYGEEVTNGAVTRVVGDIPNKANNSITIYTERSVTSGYSVVESGLILTMDPAIGNLEDELVLNTGDSRIIQGKSSKTTNNGTYYVRYTKWYPVEDELTGENIYPVIYIRSYLIIKNAQGTTTTLYSPIYSADHVNDDYNGGMFDNPYDDPLG